MGRLSWKVVLLGGLAYYAVQWIIGMPIGMLIHKAVLEPVYDQTASFWRPELNADPPDMALLPRWITTGVIVSFLVAGIYCFVRRAFDGPGWKKGAKYGLMLFVLGAGWNAGLSGVFNLPDTIWLGWTVEALVYTVVGGIVLGWLAQKLAPEPAAA